MREHEAIGAAHGRHRRAVLLRLVNTFRDGFLDGGITTVAPQPFLVGEVWTQRPTFPGLAVAAHAGSIADLAGLSVAMVHDSGAAAELEYAAYTDPFSYDLRPDLIDMGTDHYESHGRVTGSVTDYLTQQMITAYYTGLRAGLGRGDALRQAKLAMLKRPGRHHPFYWATFIQSGEWANLDGVR